MMSLKNDRTSSISNFLIIGLCNSSANCWLSEITSELIVNSILEKSNSNQNWNSDKCRSECKNRRKHHVCEKNIFIRNPRTSTCENVKYLGSIIADSVIPRSGVSMANLISRRHIL